MPEPPPRRSALAALVAVVGVVALVLGILIGRATVDGAATPPSTPPAPTDRGRLKVVSTPADSNVILDGRFVGVAPLEGLEVDPGKHTIVIDVFGYQPYSGTVELEARANTKLSVVLAPLGTDDATVGNVSGGGRATRLTVPRSALFPSVTGDPKSTAAGAPAAPRSTVRRPPSQPAYTPPARPRRDCSGESYTCRNGCSRADSDCRFSCPGCSSCLTSVGWDECKRQCDQCRNGCEQNKKFCESSCTSQESNCRASQ